ncbi:MAG TPA: hypothetical protein VHQ03_08655 [Candidatus Dormibacteraeota bacterium]|nr:hypothetical protein [Candidatus Dormibacteraeota bacterium]
MATTILVLAIRGYNPWIAVVGGVWFGLLPIGLFGLAIAVAPGRLIRWRERALAGQAGYQKVVGGWFSKRLAIDGAHPWESSEARKRVRMLGVVELVVWLAGVAVLLVLLARGG